MRTQSDTHRQVKAVLEAMSVDESASMFHEPFFSLDPVAASLVGRDQLAHALPARRAMFAAIGATGSSLRDLEVQELDENHVLAVTTWEVDFVDDHAEPLHLASSYLMRRVAGSWQVIVYLNHRDISAVLAERRDPSDG